MIGRDRELRQLEQLAASASPQVAIVAGEPGIGKTRLVHELLASLPAERWCWSGQAEPGSLARPYEVLLDAIDGRPASTRSCWPRSPTQRAARSSACTPVSRS